MRTVRRGYTLIELMVAVAASVLLMAGLTSALLLAGHAVDPPESLTALRDASDVAYDLMDEVQHTVFLLERSPAAIEFALADMNGDNQSDVVRYSWSGTAGDALQRTLNHGTPQTVLEDVRQFELEYAQRSRAEDLGDLFQESPRVTHSQLTSGSSPGDYDVRSDSWVGQSFAPNLPADAVAWSVNEVELQLRQSGFVWGYSVVEIRPAAGDGRPVSTVLEDETVWELSLNSAYSWRTLNFNHVAHLSPADALCLVVRRGDGSVPCQARYETGGVSLANHGLVESSDQGANWSLSTDKGLRFIVRGTYTLRAGAQSITRNYVTGVRVTLRSGGDASSRVHTSTPLLNTPESLSGFWQLDFDRDPTAVDADYDGAGDWIVRGGEDFDEGTLANGVWSVDGKTLDTTPKRDFRQPVTADVRFRSTSEGGAGVFRLNYDWSGGGRTTVIAAVTKQADNTQTFQLFKQVDSSTSRTVARVTALPLDFVDLRLVTLPELNAVGVQVGGAQLGCFEVDPYFDTDDDRFASVFETGGDAEFDYVSVRVGDQ
jgi:prepilin-type N-terminal cleavage/methylation domain-containing protein